MSGGGGPRSNCGRKSHMRRNDVRLLFSLMWGRGLSQNALASMFDLYDDSAVRRWARKYDLPRRPRGFRGTVRV